MPGEVHAKASRTLFLRLKVRAKAFSYGPPTLCSNDLLVPGCLTVWNHVLPLRGGFESAPKRTSRKIAKEFQRYYPHPWTCQWTKAFSIENQ